MKRQIIFILAWGLITSCSPDAIIPTGSWNGVNVEISEVSNISFNSAVVKLKIDYPDSRNLISLGVNGKNIDGFAYPASYPQSVINGRKIASIPVTIVNLLPNKEYQIIPYAEVSVAGDANIKNGSMTFTGLNKSFQTNQLVIDNEIIKCPNGTPGTIGILNNKRIEVVDRALLIKRRDEKADMSCLCTTNVTDMTELFADNYPDFNQDISSWDLSNVTSTRDMFRKAFNFNQPIGNWDVSKVTDMAGMFFFAEKFNQNLSNWNVSNVKKMHYMFREAKIFNGDISRWNVGNVDNFYSMFLNAWLFNQPIGMWNTKSAVDMGDMFWGARSFNQPIGNWDLGNVSNLAGMFNGSSIFNQDLSKWNVSKVVRMDYMFHFALNFNQSISSWDVSKVTTMDYMFTQALKFNQNLRNWCVATIKSQPINFSTSSPLTTNFKPSWGNCTLSTPSVVSKTGRIWMDRNLGASQVAVGANDEKAFGGLYQWGRGSDGHQNRGSQTITTKSENDNPGHGFFITTPDWNDWKITRNDKLWQGVNSLNNVCPTGFRLPTKSEWDAEIKTWDSKTSAGAFNSPLKLTTVGMRGFNGGGGTGNSSTYGYYWSSTVVDPGPHYLVFSNVDALTIHNLLNNRAFGFSVRCIQD